MLRQPPEIGMDEKSGVTIGELPDDLGILFLITPHRPHGGKAAGDGMGTGRNGLPEWQGLETGGDHEKVNLDGTVGDDNSGFVT